MAKSFEGSKWSKGIVSDSLIPPRSFINSKHDNSKSNVIF